MCTPLTGSQFWEGVVGKEGGDFFQGGLQLFHKSKLKSEIFNDKKLYKTKTLFSATTKNLNWEKEGGVFEGGGGGVGLTYDSNGLQSGINTHLLTVGFF